MTYGVNVLRQLITIDQQQRRLIYGVSYGTSTTIMVVLLFIVIQPVADKRLFGHISSKTHCLHNLLPPQRSVRTASSLRTRGHNFTLPHTDF